MMNDLARQLVWDLRNDPYTREHFSISSYLGKETCGSVGCIAGTAFYRAFPELQGKFPRGKQGDFLEAIYKATSELPSEVGARILGLPSISVAEQLFLPWEHWQAPLASGFADFIFKLSDNERPNLDTVEKMIAWAKSFNGSPMMPGPSACANALENVIEKERMYVDWAEAWEPA